MREKLAKQVKGVREKKTKSDKERIFHKLSPYITSTLAFHPCTTLFPIIRSKRNEKHKRGRRRTTNINYAKNYNMEKKTLKTILKTPQNSFFLCSEDLRVFIGERGHQGSCTEPRVKSRRAATSSCRENVAFAAFSWHFWGRARSAACYVLPACPPVGCTSWILDLGTRFWRNHPPKSMTIVLSF